MAPCTSSRHQLASFGGHLRTTSRKATVPATSANYCARHRRRLPLQPPVHHHCSDFAIHEACADRFARDTIHGFFAHPQHPLRAYTIADYKPTYFN
uniref:Uncharacterized protein n=1 Tax=Oryza sativa subsp. japonica TaxID=39947 RepID=Q8H5Y8_ORYSJ|nr:hypothetical protein [Oryza sativa Japonica Group]